MAHHHPQLTAHSQLASLVPAQYHYLQLPSTPLPPGGTFHQPSTGGHSFQVPHQLLRSTSVPQDVPLAGFGRFGGCIICFGSLPPTIARGLCNSSQLFSTCCQFLDVPLNEIQHEWNFENGDKLPFCMACTRAVQLLISLQNELEVIKKKISDGIESIRNKIRHSESLVHGADFRTANFRSRVLGNRFYGIPATTPSPQQTPLSNLYFQPGSDDGSESTQADEIPDFSYILNPLSTVIPNQSPVTEVGLHSESFNTPPQNANYYPHGESTQFSDQSSSYVPIPMLSDTNFPTSMPMPMSIQIDHQTNSAHEAIAPESQLNFQSYENFVVNDAALQTNQISSINESDTSGVNAPSVSIQSWEQISKAGEIKSIQSNNSSERSTNPPPKKPPKSRRKTESKRQNLEQFAHVLTNDQGQMTFEGIMITPTPTGYICGSCGNVFGKGKNAASIRKIKIHIKGVHLGAYKCHICSKNFTSNDILLQHTVKGHYQQDIPCDICGKLLRPKYVNSHKYTHMNAEEKEVFILETGFKPSSSTTQDDVEPTNICKTCGKTFQKPSLLRRHEQSHLVKESRKYHKCKMCEKSYASDQILKEHQRLHHDSTGATRRSMCKHCGKVLPAKCLQKHLLTHVAKEERSFICKICGRRMADKKTLKRHEAKHDPSEKSEMYQFECDICEQRFVTLKKMKNHREKGHKNHWKATVPSKLIDEVTVIDEPGELNSFEESDDEDLRQVEEGVYSYHLYEVQYFSEPAPGGYRCSTCFQDFSGESNSLESDIKSHIRLEHIGNLKCNLCSKRMKNVDEILAHKRSEHMNKINFSCGICGKMGITAKAIKAHVWSHRSLNDIVASINSGESFPTNFDKIWAIAQDQVVLLSDFYIERNFHCVICQANHQNIKDLSKHRMRAHPDAPKSKTPTTLYRRSQNKINMSATAVGSRNDANDEVDDHSSSESDNDSSVEIEVVDDTGYATTQM